MLKKCLKLLGSHNEMPLLIKYHACMVMCVCLCVVWDESPAGGYKETDYAHGKSLIITKKIGKELLFS